MQLFPFELFFFFKITFFFIIIELLLDIKNKEKILNQVATKTNDIFKRQDTISVFFSELKNAFGTLITNGNAQNIVLNEIIEIIAKPNDDDEFDLEKHVDYNE